MSRKYNWDLVKQVAFEEGPFSSQVELARFLGMPQRTISEAVNRGDLPQALFRLQGDQDDYTTTIRFLASRPSSVDEIVDAYGIDRNEWEVVDYSIGSRELVRLDLESPDTPEVRWSWRIKLQRRNVSLSMELPKPVVIDAPQLAEHDTENLGGKVLFVTDTHFGYKGDERTADTTFLSGVYRVAEKVVPDVIVWGGDLLDFPTFSTFTNDPAYTGQTQRALNDCAAFLYLFGTLGAPQFYLDGNHEARIDRALQKLIPSLYGLYTADDENEVPVLSVRNLLGLDRLNVTHVPGWREAEVIIDGVRYTHGDKASAKSGSTAKAMLDNASMSTVFGHVHRREMVTRTIPDLQKEIFVGTPGMACRTNVPGGTNRQNWQAGAFLITDGNYPELISYGRDGKIVFRGQTFGG